jgi:hypothetical protein
MKKIAVCIIGALFFIAVASAQKIRIGIDPGLALAKGKYKPTAGVDQRAIAGFDGGLLADCNVVNRFNIQAEVNFSMQGVELNNASTEYSIKLRYITIPVLAKFTAKRGFGVFAGPQLGILSSAKRDVSGGSTSDVKSSFKSSDVYLVFGLEYNFGGGFFFSARYNAGLSQIAKAGTGFEMHNGYSSFRLGYTFGF